MQTACPLICFIKSHARSSRLFLRQLMLLSYFSPLIEEAESVAKEQGVSYDHGQNMMFFAPPLEIPWSDVAIHVVNSQVQSSFDS